MHVQLTKKLNMEMFCDYSIQDDIGMLAAYLEQLLYCGIEEATVYDGRSYGE